MILGHSIALDTNAAQEAHFRRACGVARFAWNWSLQKWQTMHAAGEKPSAAKIKAAWNAVRKVDFPWSMEVTKSASGQAILDLGTAFSNFFRDLKKPKGQRRARFPRFKSKRKDNGFALWNDQFAIVGDRIRIPHIGWVKMHEALRFDGKIMGARISRIGHRWHVSVQVETEQFAKSATSSETVGIDLGISTLMTLSKPLPDGRTEIENPRARCSLLRRQRKLSRRISRQEIRRKRGAKASQRQRRRQDSLRRLHARVAAIRKDAIHKATTAVASAFSVVVVEDLNVSGMTKNKRLAGSIMDASFFEIRRQLDYKTAMRGGRLVVVDRWFPSSKTCSACGYVVDKLPLSKREWTCPECGSVHQRDANAAINLELVGVTNPEPSPDDPVATRGEIAALAVGRPAVKPWSVTRELQPDARAREVSASSQRK